MKLYEYENQLKSEVENYTLSEEQLKYTTTPRECIKLSEEDLDRHSILAIEDNQLVTFFVLHENEGVKPYSENAKAILLRAFSTNYNHQGKGYATKSLLLLPEFVRTTFTQSNEIILAVNVENIAAQSLYKKCGFIDNGVRQEGKKGQLIIMSFYLQD
ncbi:GNAT family N-acetyltransferase [Bacillus horti]|uniref:RimJ/RimL family protein N-acetyltransferase n=1 Tax=Caldalkalibacillus horti TaxID=77523 RepID=A0ABT9W1Y3_9BACI|nr:GNAT family N-acetyltransferase [Bacillus horti]MDQ0167259.1 RimJ/RimL family protein N-acetyltransferase [Bacillus horti]